MAVALKMEVRVLSECTCLEVLHQLSYKNLVDDVAQVKQPARELLEILNFLTDCKTPLWQFDVVRVVHIALVPFLLPRLALCAAATARD